VPIASRDINEFKAHTLMKIGIKSPAFTANEPELKQVASRGRTVGATMPRPLYHL
jgi:hypothetical protein